MEKIIHTVLNVGLETPVKILHVTDVHLTHANENDPPEQRVLETERTEVFRKEGGYPPCTPDEYFREAIELAERENALLVVTGDVMDLLTDGNVKAFHQIADGHDMMFTPGGHETQRVCRRTMEEEAPYPAEACARLKAAFPAFDLAFDRRVEGAFDREDIDALADYYGKQRAGVFSRRDG